MPKKKTIKKKTARKAPRRKKRTVKRRAKKARVCKKTVRPNPSATELQRAVDKFTGFKGEPPEFVDRVHVPAWPRVALTVGEVVAIVYRTRRDGRVDNYCHKFRKKSRPTLAVSSDGTQLLLLGGGYSVTDHGIEDR